MGRPLKTTPKERMDRLLSTKVASSGSVIRRRKDKILRYMDIDYIKSECEKRSFHLAIIGEYLVIFCFPGPITVYW